MGTLKKKKKKKKKELGESGISFTQLVFKSHFPLKTKVFFLLTYWNQRS